MTNATIDVKQIGIEKAMIRLLLRICKLEGGLITASALEEMAGEIRQKVARQ